MRILGSRIQASSQFVDGAETAPDGSAGENAANSKIVASMRKKLEGLQQQEQAHLSGKFGVSKSQALVREKSQRFETLVQRFQRNKIVSRKNEVLRLLLELAGTGDIQNTSSDGYQSESISRALMTSMVQSQSLQELKTGSLQKEQNQ